MNNEEIINRQKRIQERMKQENIEACLISSNMNIFYTSGILYSGYLYLQQNGEALHFVKRPQNVNLPNTFYIRKPEQIAEFLQNKALSLPSTLWMEADELTYNEWCRLEKIFPNAEKKNSSTKLREIRAIKSPYEQQLFREGAQKQTEAIRNFPSLYCPGMTDNDFAIEMEREMRKKGSLGIFRIFGQSMEIFMGSILTGENASSPSAYDFALGGAGMDASLPVGQNGTQLLPGQTVMVDICGNFNGYHSDQTRVFSINKTTEKALYAHQVSIEIHRELAEMGRPGVASEDLFYKADAIAKKHHLEDCFMGTRQKAAFVGHGVGLVINELPVLCPKNKMELRPGMTIAVEPKFVIEGIGAVGNENTFIVREQGPMEQITLAPEEIIEL